MMASKPVTEGTELVGTHEGEGVAKKTHNKQILKRSLKRKRLHLSGDADRQKAKPTVKRVLFNLPKRKYKWQRYKRPDKRPKQPKVTCAKSERLSSIIKKLSENVPHDICTDVSERPKSGDCEQEKTDRVKETDVTDSVVTEPLLCLDNDSNQGLIIDAGPSEDGGKTTDTETLDVSLRIADDDADSVHCTDSGLHHLKMLTEELSQLGRDSAMLATSPQFRKPLKKRKRQLDEYMESRVRTSSPKSNVRQQADCDADETPVSGGLGSMRLHTPDKKCTKTGDEGAAQQGDSDGYVTESEEMEVIDDTLEEKSKKFLLTAKNVRSIVHEVITNKDVLAMISNTIQGSDGKDPPKAAVYEPKMTRSKLKEVLEMGQLPSPWILSPIKSTQVDADADPHFLEMIFSEDEEDEEYIPTEMELKALSEFGSEVGTPIPSCSSLPEEEEEENPIEASPAKGDDAMPGPSEAATIAWRTRSKLPLENTPLEQIELGFVAPDISADMYDTYCDDTDWKNFLCSFVKNEVKPDINDSMDDEADPEYNFLAEAEKEEFDVEDFRDDREVRVSKKELHQLMDEVFDAYGASGHEPSPTFKTARDPTKTKKQKDTSAANETEPEIILPGDLPLTKVDQPSSSKTKDAAAIPLVTEEERVQIQDQMRKHVQLLTQTYVQASSRPELPDLTNLARLFLLELKGLGDKASLPAGYASFLHPPNLPAAIDIVSRPLPEYDETCNDDLKQLMIANFVPKNMYEVYGLNYEQMEIFMTSRAFVFPQMLPECHLLHAGDHQVKCRVLFSQAEDNLLAMGIDQFGHLPNKYAFIEQYVLPTKKKQQLRYRLKNLKADRTTGENSIKHLSKHTRLPDFPRYLELEDPQDMVPPQDRDPDLLPEWCEAFRATRLNRESSHHADATGVPGWVRVGSVAPPAGSDVEKKTLQVQRKKPHAHSRRKRSRKRVGVSGLNQFHMGEKNSPAKASLSSLTKVGTAHEKALVKDGVFPPVSDSENDTADPCSSENVVINAAVLSPGGSAAVKMATTPKPGFRSASPVVSGEAVGIDEPLIVLTARQLSQLGVKINISSPSVADVTTAGGSDVPNTALLSSAPNAVKDDAVASESEAPSIMELNSTEPMSVPVTVHQPSPTESEGNVDHVSDVVAMSVGEDIGDDVGVNAVTVDAPCYDDTDTACTLDKGLTDIETLPVDNTIVDTTTNVTSEDSFTVDATSESTDLPGSTCVSFSSADVVISEIVPHVTTACAENKTPQKTPPEKHTMPAKKFLSSSPSRKSTVFHRLHKPPPDTPKSKKAISILPHPISTSDFSAGSPFYPSPSKQITFLQPSEVLSVNWNLGFGLRSPGKNRRGHTVYISPLKKAAAKITARLKKVRPLRKLDRILPKSVSTSIIAAAFFGSSGADSENSTDVSTSVGSLDCMRGNDEEVRRRPDHVTAREDVIGGESESDGEGVRGATGPPESATEYEDEDNDDEDHLAQLMEASTTIRFAPKLPLSGTDICLTKAKKKRAVLLELLVPDLVARDPMRDERDTAFAQAYLTTAREVLLSNNRADIYEQLLKLLHDFGQSERSPVELYGQLKTMLVEYPRLVQEFIVFLLPEQAKQCNCFMENLESQHATTFLRKLEVHLRKHPSHLQKIIAIFLQWPKTSRSSRDVSQLKDAIKPLLRGQQHLLDEFCWFFNDEQPPQSILTEFEEVTMKDSDDEDMSGDDSYEEVELPEGDELLGSQWCKCQCHQSDVMLPDRRKTHCRACKSSGIKIIKGRIYVQASESSLKPARVVFHSPPDSRGDLESSDIHSTQCQALSQESKVDFVTLDNQPLSHDSRTGDESFDNHATQPQVLSQDSRSDLESIDSHSMQPQASSPESNVYISTVDNDPTPSQDESNDDSVKMEIEGENMDQPAQTSSTRSNPVQTGSTSGPLVPPEAKPPHTPAVDSRPQTTATVCGIDIVEHHHTDIQLGECNGDEETVRDHESPSATDIVSNPGIDDDSTNVGVASEDTAGTSSDQDTARSEDKDTVVACDDASRQSDDSLPGADGTSLPDSGWTKDEDKQILESCKQHGLGGSTFQTVASALKKSAESVSQRFYELMQLFNEQPSDPSENDSDNDLDSSPSS